MLQKLKDYYNGSRLLHRSFDVVIILKGLDGVLEIVGGLLFALVTPAGLMKIAAFLTQHELAEDPHDLIAGALVKAAHGFSVSTKVFAVLYLVSHGLIKLFLVVMMLLKRLWAYSYAIAFLVLFIAYQMYRFTHTQSVWLILLSLFDVCVILLTWLEYEKLRSGLNRDRR